MALASPFEASFACTMACDPIVCPKRRLLTFVKARGISCAQAVLHAQQISEDSMSHDHNNITPSQATSGATPFIIAIGFNTAFVVGEMLWASWSGSSALLADAVHNLGDVLGLGLAWAAILLARRAPSAIHTYGFRRTTVLAALANALLMLAASAGVAWDAIHKFRHPQPVSGRVIMAVAAVGIVVNLASALPLLKQRARDMNARAAFMHLLADAAVSFGVVVSGAAVLWTGSGWVDPASSLLVAGIVAIGAGKLLADALHLTVDGVPRDIDPAAVRSLLLSLPKVRDVHDLHVWAMSTTETALTAHLVASVGDDQRLLAEATKEIAEHFGILHITLQVESASSPSTCEDSCDPHVGPPTAPKSAGS